jgi:hypothetical protein
MDGTMIPASLNFCSTAAMYTYDPLANGKLGRTSQLHKLQREREVGMESIRTCLIRKFRITWNCLRILVLGLIEDDRTSFSDLSLGDNLTNGTGIVVGCVKKTWVPCARDPWVST